MKTINRTALCLLLALLIVSCSMSNDVQPISVTPFPSKTEEPRSTENVVPSISSIAPTKTPTQNSVQEFTPTREAASTPSFTQLVEEIDQQMEVIYYYSLEYVDYGYIPMNAETMGDSTTLAAGLNFPMAHGFQFANGLPLMAYIDRDHLLWVSDLGMNSSMMFEKLPIDDDFQIIWSPDDQYLFLFGSQTENEFLLELRTGNFREWPYRCTMLALSPRSQKVAAWCPSTESENHYAVVEWGQEIWYSAEEPETVLTMQLNNDEMSYSSITMMPLYAYVGWASDGKHVAYFDTQGPSGSMIIVNEDGKEIANYPNKAYWLSATGKKYPGKAEYALTWSFDNQKIIFYGIGDPNRPCNALEVEPFNEETQIDVNPPCWQVLDVKDGTVLWTQNDLMDTQLSGRNENPFTTYDRPVLPIHGDYITLYSFAPADYKLFTMKLETNQLVMDIFTKVSAYRWGPAPR